MINDARPSDDSTFFNCVPLQQKARRKMTTAAPTPPFQQNNESFPQKPQFKPHIPVNSKPRRPKRHIWFGIGGMVIGAGIVGGIVGIDAAIESNEKPHKRA